jgi:hypothetical protein
MSTSKRFAVVLCLLLLAAASSLASAANDSLWVNGRGGGGVVGDYASFTYWGPAGTAAGINKKAVNWDGYNGIASQNGTHYGGSTRVAKNAAPNAAGVCGDSGAPSQAGWNIKWVRAASGAGGGSGLSDAGSWSTSEPLVNDLKTTTARAMYNHNSTHSLWFYMDAGARGTVYSGILPGQDDEAVAYPSSGGVSGSAGGSCCNPSDWFCNNLALGSAANEGGTAKRRYHRVSFRDDAGSYNHYCAGNWQGIVSVVRGAMVNSAL